MSASRVASPQLIHSGDPSAAARAAAALRAGMVVAIPTDTVYGLAAAIDQPDAIGRLFALKNRSVEKAIPVLLAELAALEQVSPGVPRHAQTLIDRFWPGALTVVVPALPGLAAGVTSVADNGTRTVAVRVPDHPLARDILLAAGGALAVTSANRSGDRPSQDARSVMNLGSSAPDLVVDGGRAPLREPSTVILAGAGEITILRAGAIPAAEIANALQATGGYVRVFGPFPPHAV